MKRIVALFMVMMMVASFMATAVMAEHISGDYEYNVLSDGTASLTGYYPNQESFDLVVPEMLDGIKVKEIADYAFQRNKKIESVDIPDTVEKIGKGAFEYCENLKTVHIGMGINDIDNSTFSHCIQLSNVELPDSITRIGESAFESCEQLYSIDFPSNLEALENHAFDVSGLEVVDLSSTKINTTGFGTFNCCNNLKKVIIGGNITEIGDYSFYACNNLEEVEIDSPLQRIGLANFAMSKIKTFEIPNTVTDIGDIAFESCSELDIFLPETITNFGGSSICRNVKHITAPEGSVAAHYCAKYGLDFDYSD